VPASLAIVTQDRSGNRYQAHPASKSIYKFDPTGTRVNDSIGKGKAVALTSLIVNGHGDLFYISQQRLFRIAAYETEAERKAGEALP
jgi:hypothetical protein